MLVEGAAMNVRISIDEIETIEELVREVLTASDLCLFGQHKDRRAKLRNLAGRTRNIMYLKSAELKMQRKARERREIWPVAA